ncbi:MAG: ArsA family ATPase [Myxococcales bacterium]|nr:ArsA family ATPase [Myxococcales bacterium]
MNSLHDIAMSHKTIVCVGSGGVGKTTSSAVIALHAALSGRKTLVLTIDPAKRLANSLGLDGIGHEETQIPLQDLLAEDDVEIAEGGELWAMMLDMKEAFDRVVLRNTSKDDAERILANRFYQSFSSSLSGTQEYSAIEQLFELRRSGRYDLIVLDTPPTQHALDFLDAPDRLYEALDNSALQWMYKPALASGKVGLGIVRLGAKGIRRTLGKLTGNRMLEDTAVFLEAIAPIFDALKERATNVRELLHDKKTTFLVVTSPDPHTVAEAIYFDEKLKAHKVDFGGFVVNRVRQSIMPSGEEVPSARELAEQIAAIPGADLMDPSEVARLAEKLKSNGKEFDLLAAADRAAIDRLVEDQATAVFEVPFYSTDIYSIRGLNRVRDDLFEIDSNGPNLSAEHSAASSEHE